MSPGLFLVCVVLRANIIPYDTVFLVLLKLRVSPIPILYSVISWVDCSEHIYILQTRLESACYM